MRIELNIGVPDSLVRVVKALSRRGVVLVVAASVVVLGSLSAWAISAFTPFQPDTVISAAQVNTAFQTLYDAVGRLEAKAPEVPSGTLVAFAGSAAPDGWLLCDGRSVSKQDYSSLFDAIGTAHGGDGAPMFNIPDLRGRFLRGVDKGTGRDLDAANRARPQSGSGNSGDSVGSLQPSGTALPSDPFVMTPAGGHTHSPLVGYATGSDGNPVTGLALAPFSWGTKDLPTMGEHIHNLSGGDVETRPANVNVNWIIKL